MDGEYHSGSFIYLSMRGRILRPIIEIIRTGLAWCGVGTYNFNSLILVDICLVVYKSERTFIGAR